MKRLLTAIIVTGALVFLVNASVWEGAASASAGDDFPETGFYAATNSFPRNTVVDITNLENNKTIRVIVTGGLDNPGLLVVLSPEAAESIGLQSRSIGRVKMSQSADVAAISRFSGGLSSSGDPDFDPAAMVAVSGINPDVYNEILFDDLYDEPSLSLADDISVEEKTLADGPYYYDEPYYYTDIPGNPALAEQTPEEPFIDDTGSADVLAAVTEDEGFAEPEQTLAVAEPEPEPIPQDEIFESETALAQEQPAPAAPVEEPATEPDALADVYHSDLENMDIVLVPADERLPTGPQPGIDPNDIIPPLPPQETPTVAEIEIPADAIVPPIPPAVVAETPVLPPAPIVAETPATPPPQPIVVETPAPVVAEVPPVPSYDVNRFSAPLIKDLEKGSYYIQLAAFARADSVETELAKIGSNYPLAIQNGGTAETPVYRILVGPVNLGESGALLQRFKLTYRDAYVRLGN